MIKLKELRELRIEKVEDQLINDVKIQAIKEDKTLREAVIDALQKWVSNKKEANFCK